MKRTIFILALLISLLLKTDMLSAGALQAAFAEQADELFVISESRTSIGNTNLCAIESFPPIVPLRQYDSGKEKDCKQKTIHLLLSYQNSPYKSLSRTEEDKDHFGNPSGNELRLLYVTFRN